jgi:dinuclear metal center YbgI/SA1388 family protein
MQLRELTRVLEALAPLPYQESYDNSGLQVGDPEGELTGVLVALDITEAIIDEAVSRGANCVVAHHPVIFKGLKRLTGRTATERIVLKAIREGVALYAIHTNLDNMRNGVNAVLAERLGLQDTAILAMRTDTLSKLYTFAPKADADKVRDALFAAGGGSIGNYTECSYNVEGTGTFKPGEDTDPAIGQAGGPRENVDEIKIEVLVPTHLERKVLAALFEAHPYESVAFEFVRLANPNQDIGAGIIGTLPEPLESKAFLQMLKERVGTQLIRHTAPLGRPISRVALCGGSGSFLLEEAAGARADAFVTADYKYHQFFDADGRLLIADVGHWESEQHTIGLLVKHLREKMPNFAVHSAGTQTNPVSYFY